MGTRTQQARKQSAQQKKRKQQEDRGTVEAPVAKTEPPKRKKRNARHVKDPSEALSYLTLWKNQQHDSTVIWKFNKNTQSWLIRHMYESDKVSKATFTLLLDYLQGLQGGGKTRVRQDATRRATRYKEYERDNSSDAVAREDGRQDGGAEAEAREEGGDQGEAARPDSDADVDDATRWSRLNDHDKRKEYKRARKVLEVFKKDI